MKSWAERWGEWPAHRSGLGAGPSQDRCVVEKEEYFLGAWVRECHQIPPPLGRGFTARTPVPLKASFSVIVTAKSKAKPRVPIIRVEVRSVLIGEVVGRTLERYLSR